MTTVQQPADLDAALQQAFAHHQAGRLGDAEQIYRRILQVVPDHPGISNNLGLALKDQGRLEEAAAVFRRLIAVRPDDALAHCNLGNVLRGQNKLAQAADEYRHAIARKPDMAIAHKNLGTVLCESGLLEQSFAAFRRHAVLVSGGLASAPGEPSPPHKAQHDREQQEYLNEGAALSAARGPFRFRLEEGARVAGRAVNADLSRGEIAARWQTQKPQIAVIDNLLTDAALERLRRFCWGSTIWRKVYRDGYLGAMPEHGFACPLLAQIAEELRLTYPTIISGHPLLQLWGFKYDSRLAGIAIHADFAAVNVNFWITPDEANLDPESGGLVVWDVPAPLDWSFAKFNDDVPAAREFLARSGARATKIPHRANRAVIFDSDLFHETDRIAFKEGYLNRRINITMLFGKRGPAAGHAGED
ncbi:MAG TPA: tetratricopeptide repeat protein [Xanthobacteraceae bacterium]|nr:tetratricopeptide repeat protein [Xanthobacteraceae bacterium]